MLLPRIVPENREPMIRTVVALVLALGATSSVGQDSGRQDLVRGLCQKDGCDEFTILGADGLRPTNEAR